MIRSRRGARRLTRNNRTWPATACPKAALTGSSSRMKAPSRSWFISSLTCANATTSRSTFRSSPSKTARRKVTNAAPTLLRLRTKSRPCPATSSPPGSSLAGHTMFESTPITSSINDARRIDGQTERIRGQQTLFAPVPDRTIGQQPAPVLRTQGRLLDARHQRAGQRAEPPCGARRSIRRRIHRRKAAFSAQRSRGLSEDLLQGQDRIAERREQRQHAAGQRI